jgi:hypothetical protein
MSDRFFRPGYEHRPATGKYVVADMVRLTPERVERVQLESNDEWLLVECVDARAHVLGGEARPPAVWLEGDEAVPGGGGRREHRQPGAAAGGAAAMNGDTGWKVALRTPVPSAGLEGYGP